MELTKIQQQIVNAKGNLIVRASAGTGKTHTMVAKIAKEIEENKDYRVIAAITFTIKAAREIKERLSVDTAEHFIGTNNSFAIEEVIKPFMKDAYGFIFDREMTTDYSLNFENYEEGLEYISTSSILGSYNNNNKNFIFELALNILKRSEVARLYLKAKYFKIYVDEYQDCDIAMNNFFMYLTDSLGIDLFIVGDDKQSLYIWRGAKPEAFRSILEKESFKSIFMSDNFRSNQQIQNYSNLLFDETSHLYQKQNYLGNIVLLNCTEQEWPEKVKMCWNERESSALLRFRNDDAEKACDFLASQGMLFKFIPKSPVEDITNEAGWLYYAIAQYILIETYSVYDFIYDIPTGTEDDAKIKTKLEKYLDSIRNNVSDSDMFKKSVSELASFFRYVAQDKDILAIYKTISDERYIDSFASDSYQHRSMTFHSSKGLQFDQVILFSEDYDLRNKTSFYNHYVAVTRAKSKVIIVNTIGKYGAGQYIQNITQNLRKYNLSLNDLLTVV